MYISTDKMSTLIANEHQALHIINRFGFGLGVQDHTIAEVCTDKGVDTHTFLQVINYALSGKFPSELNDIDIPTLMTYIKNGHSYFLDFQLPRIRQELIESLTPTLSTCRGEMIQIPQLIIRFYDEYVQEIDTHIRHEDSSSYHDHNLAEDEHIADKLRELKRLIIKYYPSSEPNSLLYSTLHDIYEVEQELNLHCAIEEQMLIPALLKAEQHHSTTTQQEDSETTELSKREIEVLVQIVRGLSNKEIADVLYLSTHTVMTHRKNIARKLNIHSTAGLTIYAIVNKLVNIEELDVNL